MKEDQRTFDIVKLIPSIITLTALCLGLSSIRFAITAQFEKAIAFIVIACFLDGIDGRVARMLNVSSHFGAEMDSLADFFNFGVAPGLVMYFWKMRDVPIKGIAWMAVLLLAICMAIRLARFNVGLVAKSTTANPASKFFFQGVPAPATAGLVMLPAIMSFQFGEYFYSQPMFVIINTIVIAILAASTLPTPNLKKIKIRAIYKNLILLLFAIFIIGLLMEPWITLSLTGLAYIVGTFVGFVTYYRLSKQL